MDTLIIVGYSILLLFVDASPEAIANISPSYVFENRKAVRAAAIHLELLDEKDFMYFRNPEDCISDAQTIANRYNDLKDIPLIREFQNFRFLSSKGIYPDKQIFQAEILKEYAQNKVTAENWRKEQWENVIEICDKYITKWKIIQIIDNEGYEKYYRREYLARLKPLITPKAFEFEIFPNEIPEEWFRMARNAKNDIEKYQSKKDKKKE